MNFTNTYELTEKAIKALSRIRENRKKDDTKTKVLNEMTIPLLTTNKQITSEEYSEAALKHKFNLDNNLYEKLLSKLTEDQSNVARGIIKDLQRVIQETYQLANIKPRVFGFTELTTDSSKQDLLDESARIIKEHLDRNYYHLTTREREKKYKDNVTALAHELISENDHIDTKVALDFSYKTVLMKSLLKKINFPYLAETKIKELLESDLYKEFFDSERLHILVQEFDSKINDLSKVISISI